MDLKTRPEYELLLSKANIAALKQHGITQVGVPQNYYSGPHIKATHSADEYGYAFHSKAEYNAYLSIVREVYEKREHSDSEIALNGRTCLMIWNNCSLQERSLRIRIWGDNWKSAQENQKLLDYINADDLARESQAMENAPTVQESMFTAKELIEDMMVDDKLAATLDADDVDMLVSYGPSYYALTDPNMRHQMAEFYYNSVFTDVMQ